MILTLAALTSWGQAMAGSGAAAPGPVYFPTEYTQPRIICDPMRPDRRVPALTREQIAIYTRHLAAAQEPALAPGEKRAAGSAEDALRFTWLRSFHRPVTVRIEMRGKAMRLVAKELSGRGGYEPGSVARTAERDLSAAEAQQFKALVKASDIDSMPAIQCDQAIDLDGAHWLFEHAGRRSDYRLVDRMSPSGGPLRALGVFMLGLTGWDVGEVY